MHALDARTNDELGSIFWDTIEAHRVVPGDSVQLISEYGYLKVTDVHRLTRNADEFLLVGTLQDHIAAGKTDWLTLRGDRRIGVQYMITEGDGWMRIEPGLWVYADASDHDDDGPTTRRGEESYCQVQLTVDGWAWTIGEAGRNGRTIATGLRQRLPEAQRAAVLAYRELGSDLRGFGGGWAWHF